MINDYGGGAILASGLLIVDNCVFTGNLAAYEYNRTDNDSASGGAISIYENAANVSITNSNFTGNTAGLGGVIDVYDLQYRDEGVVLIDSNNFSENMACQAGAIVLQHSAIVTNCNLEQLVESIFINWFINCEPFKDEKFLEHSWTNFPESWKLIRLKEIIHITSGKRPGDKEDLKKDEFIYPLYGASSIMGYVSEYSYNEPILLIGRVGTLGIVQRVIDKCHPSDNTLVIKSKYYEYIFQILKRINYDAYNTGSTQPLITQKAISNIEIPLPPIEELNKFEKISATLYSEVYKNNTEIQKLTKLRDTLLPKLMSGEIDVSEINFDFFILFFSFFNSLYITIKKHFNYIFF